MDPQSLWRQSIDREMNNLEEFNRAMEMSSLRKQMLILKPEHQEMFRKMQIHKNTP
jgi:hypothetical protein